MLSSQSMPVIEARVWNALGRKWLPSAVMNQRRFPGSTLQGPGLAPVPEHWNEPAPPAGRGPLPSQM